MKKMECAPQRPAVPKTKQGKPVVRKEAALEACEKQYGTAGRN